MTYKNTKINLLEKTYGRLITKEKENKTQFDDLIKSHSSKISQQEHDVIQMQKELDMNKAE